MGYRKRNGQTVPQRQLVIFICLYLAGFIFHCPALKSFSVFQFTSIQLVFPIASRFSSFGSWSLLPFLSLHNDCAIAILLCSLLQPCHFARTLPDEARKRLFEEPTSALPLTVIRRANCHRARLPANSAGYYLRYVCACCSLQICLRIPSFRTAFSLEGELNCHLVCHLQCVSLLLAFFFVLDLPQKHTHQRANSPFAIVNS
jgi:hypothetical protein